MSDLVGFRVGVRVVFDVVVSPIFGTSMEPPEAHIHHLGLAEDNHFVGNTCGSWVISLDRAFKLGPPRGNEDLPVGDHFSCRDKDGCKFRFGGQRHDKFDGLGCGENGTIKAWKGIILWEEDMSYVMAVRVSFIEEPGIALIGLGGVNLVFLQVSPKVITTFHMLPDPIPYSESESLSLQQCFRFLVSFFLITFSS